MSKNILTVVEYYYFSSDSKYVPQSKLFFPLSGAILSKKFHISFTFSRQSTA